MTQTRTPRALASMNITKKGQQGIPMRYAPQTGGEHLYVWNWHAVFVLQCDISTNSTMTRPRFQHSTVPRPVLIACSISTGECKRSCSAVRSGSGNVKFLDLFFCVLPGLGARLALATRLGGQGLGQSVSGNAWADTRGGAVGGTRLHHDIL